MLFSPPPGYNTSSVNTQQPAQFNIPGQQGLIPQGYNMNPFRSSYAVPSSYAPPSSYPVQNYQYQQHQQQPNQSSIMSQLLMRGM